ncbi:hypothetical protein VTL71DRAFT_230 [Oculimacula yallundae]|uniref:Uncharacterized protein n=1 Tax=Oculimacula yallundae TaxID=86028 RepID=A0ABR4D0D5_9HELO
MARIILSCRKPPNKKPSLHLKKKISQAKKKSSEGEKIEVSMKRILSKRKSEDELEAKSDVAGEFEGENMDVDTGTGLKQPYHNFGTEQTNGDGVSNMKTSSNSVDGVGEVEGLDTNTSFSDSKRKKHTLTDDSSSEENHSTITQHKATSANATSNSNMPVYEPIIRYINKKRTVMLRFDTKKLYSATTSPPTSSGPKEPSSVSTIKDTSSSETETDIATPPSSPPRAIFQSPKTSSLQLKPLASKPAPKTTSETRITTPPSSPPPPTIQSSDTSYFNPEPLVPTPVLKTVPDTALKPAFKPIQMPTTSTSTSQPKLCPTCRGIHASTCLSNQERIDSIHSQLSVINALTQATETFISATTSSFSRWQASEASYASHISSTSPSTSPSSTSTQTTPAPSNNPEPDTDSELREMYVTKTALQALLAQLRAYYSNSDSPPARSSDARRQYEGSEESEREDETGEGGRSPEADCHAGGV